MLVLSNIITVMDGFKKIDFADKQVLEKHGLEPISNQLMRSKRKNKNWKKNVGIVVTILAVVIIILIFAVGIPVKNLVASAKVTKASLTAFYAAIKSQNIDVADTQLQQSKLAMADTAKKLDAMGYLQFVPIANMYYSDAQHAMKAGSASLNTAQVVINDLKPYADLLGLKGKGSFVGGSAASRISTAVLTLGKITPDIGNIASSLEQVKTEVDGIDPNHYPSWLFGKTIGSDITQIQTYVDEGVVAVNQARPFITELPALMGENSPQKYFIIFQNDKELRPGGGFITGYSIFSVDKGVITPETSADIYPLDDSIPNKPPAPAPLVEYLHLTDPVYNLRDSNLSPDFLTNMRLFKQMYAKSPNYEPVDGYIAIDTYVLTSTIKILDNSVYANGTEFTTNNDPRCDCPQVIYQLENDISRPVNYLRTDRKSLLGALLVSIMQKALQSSPKKYWGPLFQSMITLTAQKHILFDLNDPQAQKGLESLNAAGQILPFSGDYLAINDANFGGDKANLFTNEAVESDYTVGSDRTITKTVTINYTNDHAPSNCSLASGGLCLNADLRDWIRIYVPQGSQLVSNTGSQVTMKTYNQLGKTVFEGYTVIRPLGKATLTVTYKLPFKLQNGSSLPLMIQKQAGTNDNEYTIVYNGRQLDQFPLLTDRTLQLK